MAERTPPRFDPLRRRAIVFALLLVSALVSFESTVVSTAMPTIIGDLSGLPVYSWVFSIYLLASTVTMPVYGRLADILGRRRVVLWSIGIFLAGAAACAGARTMPQLILARALQGLGAGGITPVTMTIAGDLFELRERARVQALFSSVWGVAALLGPLLGAALTISFGWRSIFFMNLPLGALALWLVARELVESRAAAPDPLDVRGAAMLAGGVTALLLAVLSKAGSGALPVPARLGLLVAGAVLLALFFRHESRTPFPLVPTELLFRAETGAPYASAIILGTTIYGVDTYVPLFVQGARGGSAGAAGAVVTPVILMWSISAALGARAAVRWGFRNVARAGAILVLLGFVALILAARLDAPVAAVSAACALIGIGLGPSAITQVLAVQLAAPESRRGVATSLVPFFRMTGGALGVGALGGILSAGLASRLGDAAETAGRLLTGAPDAGAPGAGPAAAALRHAIDASLLPVFVVLLVLAAANVFISGRFEDKRRGRSELPDPAVSERIS